MSHPHDQDAPPPEEEYSPDVTAPLADTRMQQETTLGASPSSQDTPSQPSPSTTPVSPDAVTSATPSTTPSRSELAQLAEPSRRGRTPPHDLEAERSVLGAMLLSENAVGEALASLSAEDFYRPVHGYVFAAIRTLSEGSEAIDAITVRARLKLDGNLEKIGGTPYLASLSDGVPTAANINHYAKIVHQHGISRRLIDVATMIVQMGYDATIDVEKQLDQAESSIFEIGSSRAASDLTPVQPLLMKAFESIEKRYNDKRSITGISTGFDDFDKETSGLQPSDLIIIAARPSMGKTALALNLAQNAAIRSKLPVAVFSLEMSKDSLVQRMMCSEGRVDASRIRNGQLLSKDWARLTTAANELAKAPLFIDDTPALSILDIRTKARRLKSKQNGLGLIVVDYLQLMRGTAATVGNREQEISEISRGLKSLAKELDVPVVALSQLNRGVEGRTDKRPMLSDLRESGAIEQDADVICFVYRDDYYNKESEEKGVAELIIGKQRNGPTSTVKLTFIPNYTLFTNKAKDHHSKQANAPQVNSF